MDNQRRDRMIDHFDKYPTLELVEIEDVVRGILECRWMICEALGRGGEGKRLHHRLKRKGLETGEIWPGAGAGEKSGAVGCPRIDDQVKVHSKRPGRRRCEGNNVRSSQDT